VSARVLRDVLARITRVVEALRDGDHQFAIDTLEDLESDLWSVIERLDREEHHA
jgi:hypothetical protein